MYDILTKTKMASSLVEFCTIEIAISSSIYLKQQLYRCPRLFFGGSVDSFMTLTILWDDPWAIETKMADRTTSRIIVKANVGYVILKSY
jgi:hypothetical protein